MANSVKKNKPIELPILVTKEAVVLPEMTQVIGVSRRISSQAIFSSKDRYDSLLFTTSQINPDLTDITEQDIYEYGTILQASLKIRKYSSLELFQKREFILKRFIKKMVAFLVLAKS